MEYTETDGEEYDVTNDVTIDGLVFKLTCFACPEQYDVYLDNKQIGYVRLRWGHITAEYPDVMGKLIYDEDAGGYDFAGCFHSESERIMHLTEIARRLREVVR